MKDKQSAAERNKARIGRQARRAGLLAELDQFNTSAKGDLVGPVAAKLDEDGLQALVELCRSVHSNGYQEGERDERMARDERE